MKGKKILAVIVMVAMVLSTMVVLKNFDVQFVEEASATIGVDDWQNSSIGANILNMSEDDLKELYYGQTVDLVFNGTLINATTDDCKLYSPVYHVGEKGSGNWVYWVNWTRVSGTIDHTKKEPKLTDVELNVSGLWLVVNFTGSRLHHVNLSSMIYKNSSGVWHDIIGWFWVNGSEWTVEPSKEEIYYDRNDSLTINVYNKTGDPIDRTCWIDIWNLSGDDPTLVLHEDLKAIDDGELTLTGEDIYDLTHGAGAGTYQISAYEDIAPSHSIANDIYGDSGEAGQDGKMGWNSTFGNETIWSAIFAGQILNSTGEQNSHHTTYTWDTCGPFDPPEYWADYVNITILPGEPSFDIENDSIFWNDTADVKLEINVTDYDGHGLQFHWSDVLLYNKSNKPTKSTATKIDDSHFNVSVTQKGDYYMITIIPWNNTRWGVNTTNNYVWAEKGKLYVVVRNGTGVGNASEEWNGTADIDLTSAKASFKWIDDGSAPKTDGELLEIPAVANVPYDFKFQIVSGDFDYWGDGTGGETVTGAAENITISGDSLFTGKLDNFPSFDTNWFDGTSTWTVPMTPMMSMNGGEITITAEAWNKTVTGELLIGGTDYWKNGSVVTVTPNEFMIDQENRTLSITVEDGTGYGIRGADVYLYYIQETTDGGAIVNTHQVNYCTSDSSGEYSMGFNLTQQTDNQSTGGANLGEIKAPRNLTIYVDSSAGYGYAKILMIPVNDLEVEMSQTTFLAGYSYDSVWFNCTFVGNSTDTPSEDDADEFQITIYNETGEDVTDNLISSGGTHDSGDLTGQKDYEFELEDLYITEPGTYTAYAHNNTHDSTDYNATFVVEQVTVECDKSPFIWRYDDNISATFTVTYNGAPINGSLIIDNITDAGDYNKTWANTSFDGDDFTGGDDGITVEEDELTNGQITINDITANYLEENKSRQNITFWFMPAGPHDGAYARADGMVPVRIPDVTPTPSSLAVNELAELEILLTGRGIPLGDIQVNISYPGSDSEIWSRTGGDGTAVFYFTPLTTGDVEIEVENRTSEVTVKVTPYKLYIDVDSEVDEASTFTVTVLNKTATGAAIAGATVSFNRRTNTTNANGQATFKAPSVTSERELTITAQKAGYAQAIETIYIINKPKLVIVPPATAPTTGSTFEAVIADDQGNAVVGATLTINDKSYISGAQGIVTVTAPTEEGDYTVIATKTGFQSSDEVTIKIESGVPGFEVLTLIAAIGVAFILLRRRRH